MKKLLILTLLCFSSCGKSKENGVSDVSLDSNIGDVSEIEDLADMQSPDLFDDIEAHKKYCFQYKTREECDRDESRCTAIIGERCGSGLVTCVPVPLSCGQSGFPGRSPDGVCYFFGTTCMPDGFVEDVTVSRDECMNEGCE